MTRFAIMLSMMFFAIGIGRPQEDSGSFHPAIPKTWDDAEIATLEVPLAIAASSPKHVSAGYYYRIPVRPIYKQYPIYPPGRGPAGYIDWLRRQEPVIVWGEDKNGQRYAPPLETKTDWIKAGELVFDSVLGYFPMTDQSLSQIGDYTSKRGIPLAKDGTVPFFSFVIRRKGQIEAATGQCGQCHTRVMPDGTLLKGAQGNIPGDRTFAEDLRAGIRGPIEVVRALERSLFGAPPALRSDPLPDLDKLSIEEIASINEVIPAGVAARHRTSPFLPVQVPDLIGVKDRKYLDRTGLQRHRSIADLMRYGALNQGLDSLASYNGFIPFGGSAFDKLPEPDKSGVQRYSDEQLYALSLYLYSLKPPVNPNRWGASAARGQNVFEREGCGGCHTPPLYTNNKLTPAIGFSVPEAHKARYDILPVIVGTDPRLTMETLRGTGYYKVPSLKGVWYRNMFEHNGSVATLEDWFDPARLRDDYVPTGFKGYGVKTRAVKGHEFGLKLSADDKKALIAFLKTL